MFILLASNGEINNKLIITVTATTPIHSQKSRLRAFSRPRTHRKQNQQSTGTRIRSGKRSSHLTSQPAEPNAAQISAPIQEKRNNLQLQTAYVSHSLDICTAYAAIRKGNNCTAKRHTIDNRLSAASRIQEREELSENAASRVPNTILVPEKTISKNAGCFNRRTMAGK